VGLLGTNWNLDATALLSVALPIAATVLFLAQIRMNGRWRPQVLLLTAMLYAGYMSYLFLR
jgi:hypothetical protein